MFEFRFINVEVTNNLNLILIIEFIRYSDKILPLQYFHMNYLDYKETRYLISKVYLTLISLCSREHSQKHH